MRLTGLLTRSPGQSMVKSSARKRGAKHGTPRPTDMTTLRHLLASSFRYGQQGSRPTLKGQSNGVADLWIGMARTSRTTVITTQLSRRSMSSVTIPRQVQSLLGLHHTSILLKLARTTLFKLPTRLPYSSLCLGQGRTCLRTSLPLCRRRQRLRLVQRPPPRLPQPPVLRWRLFQVLQVQDQVATVNVGLVAIRILVLDPARVVAPTPLHQMAYLVLQAPQLLVSADSRKGMVARVQAHREMGHHQRTKRCCKVRSLRYLWP